MLVGRDKEVGWFVGESPGPEPLLECSDPFQGQVIRLEVEPVRILQTNTVSATPLSTQPFKAEYEHVSDRTRIWIYVYASCKV